MRLRSPRICTTIVRRLPDCLFGRQFAGVQLEITLLARIQVGGEWKEATELNLGESDPDQLGQTKNTDVSKVLLDRIGVIIQTERPQTFFKLATERVRKNRHFQIEPYKNVSKMMEKKCVSKQSVDRLTHLLGDYDGWATYAGHSATLTNTLDIPFNDQPTITKYSRKKTKEFDEFVCLASEKASR
jgi:hypothetical protein